MYYHVTEIKVSNPHHLFLQFADGLKGDLDFKNYVSFDGVFADLRDPEFFARVSLHPIAKTPVWPNGCDLDPKELYQTIQTMAQLTTG